MWNVSDVQIIIADKLHAISGKTVFLCFSLFSDKPTRLKDLHPAIPLLLV
jgi:hypothetical protein